MANPPRRIGLIKVAIFLIGLVPLFAMITRFATNPPADPFVFGARVTGDNALRLLILALAFTPFRIISGYRKLGPYRRTVGVLCSVYAFLHVFAYLYIEAGFDPARIIADIDERRYITVGFLAFVMLIPLALTSNNISVRLLGAKWRKIHYMVYPISILACIHFLWLSRGEDMSEPLIYFSIVLILLGFRVYHKIIAGRRKGESKSST